MKRYVIAFDRNLDRPAATRRLLERPTTCFVDACEHLAGGDKGLRTDIVLEFPELSVSSAVLSEDEVITLRDNVRVQSVRESREVRGSPLVSPVANMNFEAALAGAILPWHVRMVKADQCWASATGSGVKVGVIDSEIARALPDLPIVEGHSFNPNAADWFGTDDFHGTFCAGIIGCRMSNGTMVGIAPDCELYALRVNKGGSGRSEYIAAAMTWALRNRLDIVSLSQWDPTGADDPHEPPWDDVGRASDDLTRAGCIVIGIAGNSGSYPNRWVSNPGRCPQIVAVGGTNIDSSWWSGSAYGPDDLPGNQAVEIAAPGNGILSIMPDGGFSRGAGTSFAAPQVAGACALIRQLRPNLSPAEIRSIIKAAAQDLGPSGRDAKFGTGLLDCFKAISSLP